MSRIDKGAPKFKIAARGAARTPRPSNSPAPFPRLSTPLNPDSPLAPSSEASRSESVQPPLLTPPSTAPHPLTQQPPSPVHVDPQPLPPHKPHNPYLDVLAPPPIPTPLSASKGPSFGSPLIASRAAPVRQFRPQRSSIAARSAVPVTPSASRAFSTFPSNSTIIPVSTQSSSPAPAFIRPSQPQSPLALLPTPAATQATASKAPAPSPIAFPVDPPPRSTVAEDSYSTQGTSVEPASLDVSSKPPVKKRTAKGVIKRAQPSVQPNEPTEEATSNTPPPADDDEALVVPPSKPSAAPARKSRYKMSKILVSDDEEKEEGSEKINAPVAEDEEGEDEMDLDDEGNLMAALKGKGKEKADGSKGAVKKAPAKTRPKPRPRGAPARKGKEAVKDFINDEAKEDDDEDEEEEEEGEKESEEEEDGGASSESDDTSKPAPKKRRTRKPKDDPRDPVRKGRTVMTRRPRKSAAEITQNSRLGTPPPLIASTAEEHNASLPPPPDTNVMLMSDIINDNGFGRVSSRFLEIQRKAVELKENRAKARERMKSQARKAQRLRDGILGEDTDGEGGPLEVAEPGLSTSLPVAQASASLSRKKSSDPPLSSIQQPVAGPSNSRPTDAPHRPVDDDEISDISDTEVTKNSNIAAQIRIVNGQMVIDQNSLVVDQHARAELRAGAMETVEERDADRFVNSSTWGKKLKGERWSREETDLFFDAIRQFGTDFEMIARLFPGRTRKMIKNKWNREEKYNEAAVSSALMMKVPVDMRTYARMTNTDLSGPPPEIRMPTPPPFDPNAPVTQPRPQSNGPKKKKRANIRDGEEIVGTIGDDGQETRLSDDGLNMDEFD